MKELTQGTKVKCHGYIGTIVRFCSSMSYEIRLPGGLVCTDDFEVISDIDPVNHIADASEMVSAVKSAS